ncbi:MAG: cytochrome b, partial [Acetobacteraceae bacterium]
MDNGSRVLTRPQQAAVARYDRTTIALHWATAILVVLLYGIAQGRGFTANGSWLRGPLLNTHVSLGVLLAGVLALRVVWRLGVGRRLRPVVAGALGRAAESVHHLLYALLLAVVPLGFCLRWSQGRTPNLFGYFPIPSPFHLTKADENLFFQMHWWV